ncbi:MAG TPA: LodA/GoxA family CTQ-dependent oxidase [Longimicrobiales bacterium]|nr:LodA/GoxA family CTQ-dependent oxidase [Longimicrobiales bacterium]
MSDIDFRIHPTINFARVGTSQEYYIAPETAAGTRVDPHTGLMGGLPIKKGTEDTPIQAGDLREGRSGDDRDALGKVKRQAARFRIYAYPGGEESYPNGGGVEVEIGARVGDRNVKDIVWTVHVANKKANFYAISTPVKGECVKRDVQGKCVKKQPLRDDKGNFIHCETYAPGGTCPDDDFSVKQELGIAGYEERRLPPARNFTLGADLNDAKRLKTLMIDPGPRAIASSTDGAETLEFRAPTREAPATWADAQGDIHGIDGYPSSFPDDHFEMLDGLGTIDTLGEVTIEAGTGRLLVLGGYGRAAAMLGADGKPPALEDAIDNDGWFDDTSDGPVNAVIVFDDGSTAQVHGAWVVTTDPSYAPQTRNVVSVWDDIFDAWVRRLGLMPDLYTSGAGGAFQPSFAPSFDDDVMPIFHGAMLQQWNTNLPSKGVNGHKIMGAITPATDPKRVIPDLDQLIRDPNKDQTDTGVRMPLALGDAQRSFLEVTPTQHFFLKQWHEGHQASDPPTLGAGERLDRAVLENCLGGRYSPGIDLTFIVRQPDLYVRDWQSVGCGPFRINQQPMDYTAVQAGSPFLGVGWVPLRNSPGVQPGDLSKFMALPWHTDYNSCATHTPDPNPRGNNTLYWSWPAQRPVHVYPAEYCTYDAESKKWYLGGQVYSIRGSEGQGTSTPYPQQQGRYQCYFDFVENWERVGFIIQGLRIPADQGGDYGAENFLEVSSGFDTAGDVVQPWPTIEVEGYRPPVCGPHGAHGARGSGDG